ncbi:WXG100 family type VII secretion target [Mycobacterium rhizamassiliense]|uniref:WXG100 family type VII secretion target n=1 Tax=Mycobacterium rhizamassiliense TaxID=1841860 RepID=UPI00097DA27F|nr:hypothetical protein [Mycobacterium rhizamassiliense]
MGSLTPADVKRWDPNAIHAVFQTASGRAKTLQHLGDSLDQAHNVLADWQGEAGDAFRVDLGKIRRDIETDGAESKQVAAAVSQAEGDVTACERELDDVERAAQANGWSVTADWRIKLGDKGIDTHRIDLANELQILQGELNACKVHAHNADHELAAAIGSAVGDVPAAPAGPRAGGAPPQQGPPNPAPGEKPKTWKDLLMPGGPASAGPDGAPPKGVPDPAGAGVGGKPKTWKDLVLPATPAEAAPGGAPPKGAPNPAAVGPGGAPLKNGPPSAGVGGAPKTWKQMLLPGGPADAGPGGVPLPRPSPAELENARTLLRKVMMTDGTPPDQIEARINEYLSTTPQQWIDRSIPDHMPSEPKAPPPPGFGEGFGDRWFATEQQIHDLLGVGGKGAPGALKAWAQLLSGTAETAVNPVGGAINEAQSALDSPSPAYFLGQKASDGAWALPGMIFGGEGAAVGRVADLEAAGIDYGPTHLPHAPIGLDNPIHYHSFADQAGQDLYSAFAHGEPTTDLNRVLADMSTHYVGDNPDRVILGKFDGHDGGYIGGGRGEGGIYFDTGDPAWDAMTYGLGKQEQSLVWPVNEQFLRAQMENHVGRIDYILDREKYTSLEDMMLGRVGSYSAMEVDFLNRHAAAYGYERVGNSWVYIGAK